MDTGAHGKYFTKLKAIAIDKEFRPDMGKFRNEHATKIAKKFIN